MNDISEVHFTLDVSGTSMRRVAFDIETELFSDIFRSARSTSERVKEAPRMRLACLFDEHSRKYRFFAEKDVKSLIRELQHADEVISYNGKQFDLLVLRRHYGLVGRVPKKGKHVDLCSIFSKRYGFNVPLDLVARLNLGESKHTDGRKMAALDSRGLKKACRSDVSQTYRLWQLYAQRRLRHPTRPAPGYAAFESFGGPGDHMPETCDHCGARGRLEFFERDTESMSDGQLADYEAGLRGLARCKACGEEFFWHR